MIKKVIASLSSIIAALLASSCCWLPFVLLGIGVSGGAIAAKMSQFRPLFLLIAIAALAYSILLYMKSKKTSHCCDTKRSNRFNWHLLSLISTTFVVLAISFYPLYYPLLRQENVTTSKDKENCNSVEMIEKLESIENETTEKKSCCP